MKNRLPSLFALCLLAGLFSEKISAQNFQVYIVGNEAICSGQCTDLTVVVTGASGTNLSFLWSGPGNFSATQSSVTACNPGTYTVRVLGNNGAVAWAEFVVYGIPSPQLLIFSDNKAPCNDSLSGGQPACEKVCPYSTVTYSAIGGTGGQLWGADWSIFGAQSYTFDQQNNSVTVTWGGPGTGSLTVFSGDSLGCPGEATKCVTIIEPPQAEIGAAPAVQNGVIKICKGGTVYFENQSQDADYFEWDFGNGQTSLLANPTITFNQPGTFTARLIASSACLCSDTTEVQIQVESGDTPSLDCVGTICAGETVTYTSSTSCGGYIWQVSPNGQVIGGGGLTDNNITIQWTDGPLGTIQLGTLACVGNVCPEPAIVQVPIIADNAEIKGTARVCPSAEEVYSIEPFSGTNFVWTVASGGYITSGQGTHEIKVQWTSPSNVNTTHWLSVEYTNCYLGCSGRDSLAVKILSPFFITGPVEVCEDGEELFSAKLSSNNSPFSCQWSLNAPAGGNTWNSASASTSTLIPFADGDGSYRILATPADPSRTCTDRAEWALTAKAKPAKPTAILGETTICPGQIYEYEADGVSPGNNVVWQAQNGGPATSATENATTLRTWGAANPRWLSAAQITADDLACRSDTVRVNIADLPPISMSGKPLVCIGEVANYAVQNFQNIDYQWQITPSDAGVFAEGNGTGAVEVFWQKPGTHTLRVTVCGKTATQNITVVDVPAPDVQHPAGLCPNFVDAVMTTVPTYSTWTWLDDTGAVVSTDAVPDLGPGTYAVEVRDANGCPAKTEFTIDEFPSPNLSVTTPDPTGFCNNSVFVTMSALVTADGDYTYNWFKDNVPLGVNTPTYTTNQYGKYTVNVVNQFGCPAKDGPITLFEYCGGGVCHNPSHPQTCPPGTVDIAIDPATVCNTFQFHNSSGPLYQPGTAQWAFGESGGIALGTSFDENPLFMFPNAGHYIVVLYATATNGAVCKDLDSVRVRAVARFEATPGCPGFPTVFKDISTFLPGEAIAGWAWNFGDPASGANNISTAQNPSHTFAAPGDYSVSLTVSMVSGCTATWSLTVKVPPAPTTSFAPPAAACAGNALEFNAASDVTEITWNFADPASGAGNSAKVTPAYHTFSAPGSYVVAVTAKNVFGCESSFSQPVTVHPNTLAGNISMFPNSPLCEGKTTMLTAPAGAASYKWSDGSTASTLIVGNEGKYTVTLTNAQGCTFAPPPAAVEILPAPDALVKAILKNDLGQIVGTAYPSLTICAGEDVFLNGIGGVGSGAVFSWSGGGTSKTLEFSADKFNQLPVGAHTFTVTVTATTTGCTAASPPFPVQVNPNPANIFISSTQWPPCAGTSNTLTYSGSQPAGTQFIWNTGHIGTTLTTTNPGQYFLRAQNQFGCSAESNRVAVLPGPNRAAIPSGCHTRCRPDTLCLPALPGVVAWQWLLNGTPIPGANSPNFIATSNGAYSLQMTDNLGCTATSDPLVLDLYDGYGTVAGQVWADVNGNGQIDPGVDTLVAGIPVLLSENGTTVGNSQSNASGDFAFANILSTNYSVSLDLPNLPAGWTVVIGQQNIALSGCDDLEKAGLLLTSSNCPPSFGSLQLAACAGDFATYNGEPIPAG
ncbi:MAG: PKD domain-containing protein, partial [Saprospiraceae bacterium]